MRKGLKGKGFKGATGTSASYTQLLAPASQDGGLDEKGVKETLSPR